MSNLVVAAVAAVADTTVDTRPIPSADAWFAGGERVGYDPGARATIAGEHAVHTGGPHLSSLLVPFVPVAPN
jgi:hypothetical protein